MGIFFTALAVSNESLLNNWGITIPEWWKSIAQSIGNRKESIYEIKDEDYTKVIDRVIMVDIGIGEFNITDDITSSYITINSNYYENYGEPQFTESFEDSKLTIDLKQQSNFNWGFNMSGPKYTLNLGQPDVNTDFNIKLGAGSGSLNLTSLVTKSLIAEVGAGSLNIDLSKDSLPSNGGTIKVGTGEVVIIVPESIGYKIKYKVGLGSFTINGEKINKGISDNQTYQSENYTKAANKLEINVEVGVGSFKLETE